MARDFSAGVLRVMPLKRLRSPYRLIENFFIFAFSLGRPLCQPIPPVSQYCHTGSFALSRYENVLCETQQSMFDPNQHPSQRQHVTEHDSDRQCGVALINYATLRLCPTLIALNRSIQTGALTSQASGPREMPAVPAGVEGSRRTAR